MHQINIHGDNLDVVNTGVVGSIKNNVSIISREDSELARKLANLTNAILASTSLDGDKKREATDFVNEIAEDFAKPPQERRSRAVMKVVAGALSQVLATSADVYTLWTAVLPYLGIALS